MNLLMVPTLAPRWDVLLGLSQMAHSFLATRLMAKFVDDEEDDMWASHIIDN